MFIITGSSAHLPNETRLQTRDQCVGLPLNYTRKNAQVATNLQQTCSNAVPTTCQQDVFALLVPSLLASFQRLVDNLLQGC
jgi:hypothetical protein